MKKMIKILPAMIGAALITIANQGLAEDQIAASPKVRQMLNERKVAQPPSLVSMACSKCKDVWTARKDHDAKGSEKLLSVKSTKVAAHLCKGCTTEWDVKGQGKDKSLVSAHKCVTCGSQNLTCCSTKRS